MNERAIVAELQRDLQRAAASGTVVYLEGRSDVPIFFALLGVRQPQPDASQGVLHHGVLVRGLREKDRGSGSSAVQQRIEVAQRHGFPGIHGIVDGDGQPLTTLASTFDPPRQCKGTPDRCRDEWLGHAVSSGGLPEVRDLWQRITGRPAS
jgi:hypothetical protein